MKLYKFLLFLLVASVYAGEYHSIIIRDKDKICCDCDCEYKPDEDAIAYNEKLWYRYKYFGGAHHVCIGDHIRDEKGIDLSKKHKPHVCYGEWCDAKCCFSVDDYFALKYESEKHLIDIMHNKNNYRPVKPTPPPASIEN